MASTIGASRSSAAVERAGQAPRLRIRAVDTYPIYINQRSDGLLDPPTFACVPLVSWSGVGEIDLAAYIGPGTALSS